MLNVLTFVIKLIFNAFATKVVKTFLNWLL